jgi:hypothetical protein
MTLRGSINLFSAALLALGILSSYFTFSVKHWIDGIENRVSQQENVTTENLTRFTKLESESTIRWVEMDRRLGSIEYKLDRLLEGKSRR